VRALLADKQDRAAQVLLTFLDGSQDVFRLLA
jgi:hypothetical protein